MPRDGPRPRPLNIQWSPISGAYSHPVPILLAVLILAANSSSIRNPQRVSKTDSATRDMREALQVGQAAKVKGEGGMGSGFKTFLLRGNLVDMAVGIVIGIAFGAVVTGFVKDLITPIIAALFGKPDFSGLYFTINHSKFLYGDFFNVILAFVIIAAVLYFLGVPPYATVQAPHPGAPVPPPRATP